MKELLIPYRHAFLRCSGNICEEIVKFHQEFPQILDSLRPKSGRPLSWTHYRILLQETSPEARAWYAKEAQEQAWSVRTLQRNISSQYYYRMLMSQNTEPVEKEMKELTATYQADKLEFIKNPVIAEFLGLSSNTDFTESELEQRIITHIQKFLLSSQSIQLLILLISCP